jgi:aminopeptidase N
MFDDSIQKIVPIENPVYTSVQIGTIFNSITYDKGASVMRMIEATVGKTNFQQALNVCFC